LKPRVLILGATGVFGERLARRLAIWPQIELVLAARSVEPLEALASELGAEALPLDRGAPDLDGLDLFAVIDCAGPFQGADYSFCRAVLAAGADYIDIADGRDFVAGFEAAITPDAVGAAAITGASSTPALSHAALDSLTAGWSRIDRVSAAISPGARAPKGLAVVRSILSWAGRPVHVFTGGAWTTRPGWSGLRRADFPGLGRRWLALAETPDLDLLVARYRPAREALFMAGLESSVLHLGLWVAAWAVRLKLIRSLAPIARPMKTLAEVISRTGSDLGGMVVRAEGHDADGRPVQGQWSLAAPAGIGPHVPTLAAQASLRALLNGRIQSGAQVCTGLLSLEDILAEAEGLGLETRIQTASPAARALFPRLLGSAFDALPPTVQQVHGAEGLWHGRAQARGSKGLAVLARAFAGLKLGRFPNFSVGIQPRGRSEAWTRHFGPRAFQSVLRDAPDRIGVFEEGLGPLRFALQAEAVTSGFDWLPLGWRIGPLPLPRVLMPLIRARSFERDGVYRFRVRISHPLCGLIVAYAGSLRTA
jgi:NAD(P)-dependent dehydrogenase (short-subunit alcohol dehydrogenase family)